MMTTARRHAPALLIALCVCAPARGQDDFTPTLPDRPHDGETICTPFRSFEWRMEPGAVAGRSPEAALLREDPETGASEMMVRLPPGFRLPKHWHSANQTHSVISGTYVMAAEGGEPVEMPAGSFNFTPAWLVHEGWVGGDEPAVLFVTFDGPRDNRTPERDGRPEGTPSDEFVCITPDRVEWQNFDPDDPAQFAILHEHPATGATQLLIRCPGDYYVPKHWHSANETHTILDGSFILVCGGSMIELDTGSYNYIPGRLVHNARVGPEGTTLLITVDGPWDINWVEPPFSKGPSDPEDVFARH